MNIIIQKTQKRKNDYITINIDNIKEIYEISDRSIFADANEARCITEMP